MRTLTIRLGWALAWCWFWASTTSAQPVELAWRWAPGEERFYDVESETVVSGGRSTLRVELDLEIVERVDTCGAETLGRGATLQIVREILAVSVRVEQGDTTAAFDSRMGVSEGEMLLIEPFTRLVGTQTSWTVDESGRVVSAKSTLDGAVSAGLDAISGSWPTSADPEAQRRLVEASLAVVPNRRVRRGETWDVLVEQPTPAGTARSSQTHRLARYSGRTGLATIQSRGTFIPGEGLVRLSGSIDGELVFDTERGVMLEHRVKTKLQAESALAELIGSEIEQSAVWKLREAEGRDTPRRR